MRLSRLREVKKPELDLAKQIIASLAAPFDPAELRSEYRASAPCGAGGEGWPAHEIALPEEPATETPVVDLMEALRASVAAASKKPPRKKRPRRLLARRPPRPVK